MDRLDKHLDVVHFVRKQIQIRALVKSMTTKLQRVDARRNPRLILGSLKEVSESTSSEIEIIKDNTLAATQKQGLKRKVTMYKQNKFKDRYSKAEQLHTIMGAPPEEVNRVNR